MLPPPKLKFPDFHPPASAVLDHPLPGGVPAGERWPAARRDSNRRRGRQKSLSEAIHAVRARGRTASISQNAHEIADSLRAPLSVKLVLLCAFWYAASILTNTSSKAILTALPQPVTLTIVQFALLSFWCVSLSWLAKRSASLRNAAPVLRNGIRKPTRDVIMATLPLTAFQIGGHILNSDAMSKIPVSLVHTIKGLSPLMTVAAYRVFLNVKYSAPTYLSLIPLTLGVILACSASFKANFLGLLNAFGSAILFVTQNIVSKKLFTDSARAEADGVPIARRKPDKLNLLCYSSLMALAFTFPIWLWSEGFSLVADFYHDASIDLRVRPGSLDHGRLTLEFLFNGTFHFAQSLVAFVLLGMTSPVTYSVASLIKRVVVIMFAIVWFGNPMTGVQGFGFLLTFLGLYLYDRTSDADKHDRKVREREAADDRLLPLNVGDGKKNDAGPGADFTQSPMAVEDQSHTVGGMNGYVENQGHTFGGMNGYGSGEPGSGPGRPHSASARDTGVPISLPPGTKAAETWNQSDVARQQASSAVR